MNQKTIRVEGLKKVYGEYTVLNDVSFTINEQEIFCLLGHNGAGKTTLVNILTGLVSATEGKFYCKIFNTLGIKKKKKIMRRMYFRIFQRFKNQWDFVLSKILRWRTIQCMRM